jgi:hypothetical protein
MRVGRTAIVRARMAVGGMLRVSVLSKVKLLVADELAPMLSGSGVCCGRLTGEKGYITIKEWASAKSDAVLRHFCRTYIRQYYGGRHEKPKQVGGKQHPQLMV